MNKKTKTQQKLVTLTRKWLKGSGITQAELSIQLGCDHLYVENALTTNRFVCAAFVRMSEFIPYPPELMSALKAEKSMFRSAGNSKGNHTLAARRKKAKADPPRVTGSHPYPLTVAALKARPPAYNFPRVAA